jgi:iduronate 2-sulfatase
MLQRARLFLFLLLASAGTALAEETATKRPNVLFIAVDDLRPELGTYGAHTHTPNIDRLAATGLRFDRAYCQQAVCGASRLSLMGGLYPTRTEEQTYHVEGWRTRWPNLLTMNQHFRNQGYQTVGLGKIYHGTNGPGVDLDNWDQWLSPPASLYALPENQPLARRSSSKGPKTSPKGPLTENADVPDTAYADGLRARRAAAFLRAFAEGPENSGERHPPFFLAVGLTKPHLPFTAPKKYWDLYQRKDFHMPPNAGIPPGYPTYAANLNASEMAAYDDFEGERPTDFSDELNQRLLHGYAACVSYADANVGLILDALEESCLTANTIVVLWGDHGWKLGDHSSWCKHTNFECDTRVPLIIRAPGKQAGNQSAHATSRLVELIDLYPTLCELTGLETPAHCQGRSFANLFDDPQSGHRMAAYSSYPAGAKNRETGHSIRFGNYRYTEWRSTSGKSLPVKRVLTQIEQDPGEETNGVNNPQHADALKRAEVLLERCIRHAADEATPLGASTSDSSGAAMPTPLKEAARGKFKFGVGIDVGVFQRPQDLALLKRHFQVVTPENCMKTTKVQATEGNFDFAAADRFMDMAERHGLEVVGHNLIWSRSGTTPAWFFKEGSQPVSRERLLERLRTHIHTVVGRYRGRIQSWDVVNEALADSDDEYLRRNEWMDILGEEFIVKAYQYAREADPDAFLIYNDYRCDQPGKLQKIIRLIESVREQGGPIDVLGLQGHYEYGLIPYHGIETALNKMRERGVRVVFSELDMDVVTRIRWYSENGKYREEMAGFNPYPEDPPPDVLASQAEQYARLFELICRHADVVDRVTFWNLHDGESWLNNWPWPRTNHPLLFDRQRRAKPAFHAAIHSLTNQPDAASHGP